jgi:hypothetical protein
MLDVLLAKSVELSETPHNDCFNIGICQTIPCGVFLQVGGFSA